MEPFTQHTGVVSIVRNGNIDTDQIISKEFLKSIQRTGFGENLFYEWRFHDDGSVNKDFELNDPHYKGTSILVTGNNFGCGSSREHAVWAIMQFGYRVIIAPKKVIDGETIPGFADIFKNNSFKNGLLLIELSENDVNEIYQLIEAHKGSKATVNLKDQIITFEAGKKSYSFDIDSKIKEKLLKGLDEIGQTELYNDRISAFEKSHLSQMFSS